MAKKNKNIHGGGARTNLHGLKFEQITSLKDSLRKVGGFKIKKNEVYYKSELIGILCEKNALYNYLLEEYAVDYRMILSKKLIPDDAIIIKSTLYIIEKKFQNVSGSVDEKLQTCDFKLKQYKRLVASTDLKVEYIYVLNDWFKQPSYRDVLQYIRAVGCKYYFNEIPLEIFGISGETGKLN